MEGRIETRGKTSWERGKKATTAIAKIRYRLRLTQPEFAKECGINSAQQVSQYESGRIVPSIKTALNIIEFARKHDITITLDDFYRGEA